jgi:hypothetical protein
MSQASDADNLKARKKMALQMTSRLLMVVIAVAVSSGLLAHAAQGPRSAVALKNPAPISFKLPQVKLPTAADVQNAVHNLSNQTLILIDPKSEPIRAAYLRDREALEKLRHDPRSKGRGDLDDYISIQQTKLQVLEDDALDQLSRSAHSVADARISEMHHVVAHAQATVSQSGKQQSGTHQEDSSN